MFLPACLPPCRAGWASCGSASGVTATSPAAKMLVKPWTRMSASTVIRPPRPCGRPHLATTFGAVTPVAQMTTRAGRNSPLPRVTPSGLTSLTEVFSRSSTPRSRSSLAAYSRSVLSNGGSTTPPISTSTMWVRRGSSSG